MTTPEFVIVQYTCPQSGQVGWGIAQNTFSTAAFAPIRTFCGKEIVGEIVAEQSVPNFLCCGIGVLEDQRAVIRSVIPGVMWDGIANLSSR